VEELIALHGAEPKPCRPHHRAWGADFALEGKRVPSPLQGLMADEFAVCVVETISDYLHETLSRIERCILLSASEFEFRAR